ncbi:hypothetical protein F5890DRAFT_1533666 [Lentinula detonsa]|uniref:Protein kinase domain-containing protein n=1 Tax=Lentinula detonsa TaxID=2804962 RepID=A0AA38PU40_9AGAR|nr:hypothetical protein F5890DRAFT_1533666 [Lentinula detonsa]
MLPPATTAAAVIAPGLLVAVWLVFRRSPFTGTDSELISIHSLRKRLPQDLTEWRTHTRYITSWNHLRRFLAGYGYKLWAFDPLVDPSKPGVLAPPGREYGNPSGFLYAPSQVTIIRPSVTQDEKSPSDLVTGLVHGPDLGLGGLAIPRRISWPARHDHGDVVIRVLSVDGDGLRALKILRQVATAPEALNRSNHTLPLFREIVLEDIILGVFPRVTASLAEVFVSSNMSFVAETDILQIFIQCLEALDFLHQNLIAHLNVTFENFLIDFPPFSRARTYPLTGGPRVYITNFDRAVSFSPSTPVTERFCLGEYFFLHHPQEGQEQKQEPAKDTFLARKRALENAQENKEQSKKKVLKLKPPEIVDLRHQFSPFPVDCWQFASGVLALEPDSTENSGDIGFKTIEPIHEIFRTMASDDPTCRPLASDALISLHNILYPS